MKQKPMSTQNALKKRTKGKVKRTMKFLPIAAVLLVLSVQSAHADIVDQLRTLGTDVEAWANIIIPTIIVAAFIGIIYYVALKNPRWVGALAVFVVAILLWNSLDSILVWAQKIGGGNGTVQIVQGAGGGGGGGGPEGGE